MVIGNGVVMDFSDKPDGYKITAADTAAYFDRIGYTLHDGDIVLLRTDAYKLWGKAEYLMAGAGMSAEATLWAGFFSSSLYFTITRGKFRT